MFYSMALREIFHLNNRHMSVMSLHSRGISLVWIVLHWLSIYSKFQKMEPFRLFAKFFDSIYGSLLVADFLWYTIIPLLPLYLDICKLEMMFL